MPLTSIAKTWMKRIESGVFTQPQCRQWCNAVYSQSVGFSPSGHKTAITSDEAMHLVATFNNHGEITLPEKDESIGLYWLQHHGNKILGIPKDAIAAFDHFTFTGKAIGSHYMNWYPLWHVHTTDAYSHDVFYYRVPWQHGGSVGEWWLEDKEN